MIYQLLTSDPNQLPFNKSGIAVIEVQGKSICLTRFKDQWYAFASKCPHASGPMHEGFVDAAGYIVCPVHKYRFSMKNGLDAGGEGYKLKTYKLELRGTALYVAIETFNFL
jgi:nitrite reductase/ring-hydroxylating ferredoxin subunit